MTTKRLERTPYLGNQIFYKVYKKDKLAIMKKYQYLFYS